MRKYLKLLAWINVMEILNLLSTNCEIGTKGDFNDIFKYIKLFICNSRLYFNCTDYLRVYLWYLRCISHILIGEYNYMHCKYVTSKEIIIERCRKDPGKSK